MNHEQYMTEAFKEAQKAYHMNEVPVGAIVVKDGEIIGRGHNHREHSHTIHEHAEIVAMNRAAEKLKTWNLEGCSLYVTVEPCQMCAGALIQAHLDLVVFGVGEPNSGSLGSVFNLYEVQGFNHYPEVISGIYEEPCRDLMKQFFQDKRRQKIKVKRVDETTFEDYKRLRNKVFVIEQGVGPSIEFDEYDSLTQKSCTHICAVLDNTVIGTARYLKIDNEYKIGRVTVDADYRNLNVGSKLLQYIEKQAQNNGIEALVLGSQCAAQSFYKKNGYDAYGEIFDDAGIDHIMMRKQIKD